MTHFDIEAYAKETLDKFTLSPNKDTWQSISDKLDEQQRKKRQRISNIKVVIVIALLVFGSVVTENKKSQTTSDTNRGIHIKHKDAKLAEKIDNVHEATISNSIITNTSLQIEGHSPVAKNRIVSVPTRKKIVENIHTAESVQKNKGSSEESSILSYTEVTDAEIDSLMEKARQNMQRERALLLAKEIFSREMLADIEKEIEADNKGFYKEVKRKYMKLKTIISN